MPKPQEAPSPFGPSRKFISPKEIRKIELAKFHDSVRRAKVAESLAGLLEKPGANGLVDIDIAAKRLEVEPDEVTATLKATGTLGISPNEDTAMIRSSGPNKDGNVFSLRTIIALNDKIHLAK